MGSKTHIQWTDATWNPWQGCHRVSAGCKLCYMFREKKRYGQDPATVVRSTRPTFNLPLRRFHNGSLRIPLGSRVFVCSWSDFFIEEADAWRDEAWEIMRQRPDLIFQITTKRIERATKCFPSDWGNGWPNVWIGTSVESPEVIDRIDWLLNVPAAVRWISAEPLLADIELFEYIIHKPNLGPRYRGLDWVVVGGESGHGARPCNIKWIKSIVTECKEAGVPVFVKQLGKHPVDVGGDGHLNLKDKKGGDINEFPKDLQVREFPV